MILYDHGSLEVCDGPDAMPGSVRLHIHDVYEIEGAEGNASILLPEARARQVANALTRGKLQALLDAFDAIPDAEGPYIWASWAALKRAREALR